MAIKKFATINTLSEFLDNLKVIFANIAHTHTKSEITDLVIDTELSSTSENLVQNKVINSAIEAAKDYTDVEIANLVNSAPETLDTLGELAIAFQENDEVVDALNNAITAKADADIVLSKTEQTLTDDEIDQVHTNLHTEQIVENGLAWKLVGTATGDGSVTLPDAFNELCIEIRYWGTCGLFNIPYPSLSDEDKYYLNGFYGASTSYGYFYICVNLSSVRIFEVYFNGVEVTSECYITVYKR